MIDDDSDASPSIAIVTSGELLVFVQQFYMLLESANTNATTSATDRPPAVALFASVKAVFADVNSIAPLPIDQILELHKHVAESPSQSALFVSLYPLIVNTLAASALTTSPASLRVVVWCLVIAADSLTTSFVKQSGTYLCLQLDLITCECIASISPLLRMAGVLLIPFKSWSHALSLL